MSEQHRSTWMQTSTGLRFHPDQPDPAVIHHLDIANGLSLTCRFSGQIKQFYSVAEHSILLVEYAKHFFPDMHKKVLLAILLHDATEAYLGDLTTQVKSNFPDYKVMEAMWQNTIFDLYGCLYEWETNHSFISELDTRILLNEKRALYEHPDMDWGLMHELEPLVGVSVRGYSPQVAKAKWLDLFNALTPVGILEDMHKNSRSRDLL